jgi:hypothetical protein
MALENDPEKNYILPEQTRYLKNKKNKKTRQILHKSYSINMRSFLRMAPFLASTVTAAAIASVNAPYITAHAAATGNPFSRYQLYANSYYASEVSVSALPSMTGTAETAASQVSEVPSFYWL